MPNEWTRPLASRSACILAALALGACNRNEPPDVVDVAPADTSADSALDDARDDAIDARDATDVQLDVNMIDAYDVRPDLSVGPRMIQALNGCDIDGGDVLDMSDADDATIVASSSFTFIPRCARIRPGQTVTFRVDPLTNWLAHPLVPGVIIGGVPVRDPDSPIPDIDGGMDPAYVTFPDAGSYGFFCPRHYGFGFLGAVHAIP